MSIQGYFFNDEWWIYKRHTTIRNDRGELHCEDKPAIVFYNEHGGKFREEWYYNGVLNRISDDPAVVTYYLNGKKSSETWYKDNVIHNDIGPAHIIYDSYSEITLLEYYKNGLLDNGDRPARVFFKKGIIHSEEWYCNGQVHRLNGPATVNYGITYYEDCSYYILGKKLSVNQYKKLLPMYKRIISVIKSKRRKILSNRLKCTNLKYNGPDICSLVSSYIY